MTSPHSHNSLADRGFALLSAHSKGPNRRSIYSPVDMTIDVEGCLINARREAEAEAEAEVREARRKAEAEAEAEVGRLKTLYEKFKSLLKKINEVVEYYKTPSFISSVFTASGDLRDDFDADDESDNDNYEFNYLLNPIYDSNEIIYEIMKDILKINYAHDPACEKMKNDAVMIFNKHQGALQRRGFRQRDAEVWRKNTYIKTGEKYSQESEHKIQLRRINAIIDEHYYGGCEGIYPPTRKLPLKDDDFTGSSFVPLYEAHRSTIQEHNEYNRELLSKDAEFYNNLYVYDLYPDAQLLY